MTIKPVPLPICSESEALDCPVLPSVTGKETESRQAGLPLLPSSRLRGIGNSLSYRAMTSSVPDPERMHHASRSIGKAACQRLGRDGLAAIGVNEEALPLVAGPDIHFAAGRLGRATWAAGCGAAKSGTQRRCGAEGYLQVLPVHQPLKPSRPPPASQYALRRVELREEAYAGVLFG